MRLILLYILCLGNWFETQTPCHTQVWGENTIRDLANISLHCHCGPNLLDTSNAHLAKPKVLLWSYSSVSNRSSRYSPRVEISTFASTLFLTCFNRSLREGKSPARRILGLTWKWPCWVGWHHEQVNHRNHHWHSWLAEQTRLQRIICCLCCRGPKEWSDIGKEVMEILDKL